MVLTFLLVLPFPRQVRKGLLIFTNQVLSFTVCKHLSIVDSAQQLLAAAGQLSLQLLSTAWAASMHSPWRPGLCIHLYLPTHALTLEQSVVLACDSCRCCSCDT
jgi:hypothetical protein